MQWMVFYARRGRVGDYLGTVTADDIRHATLDAVERWGLNIFVQSRASWRIAQSEPQPLTGPIPADAKPRVPRSARPASPRPKPPRKAKALTCEQAQRERLRRYYLSKANRQDTP